MYEAILFLESSSTFLLSFQKMPAATKTVVSGLKKPPAKTANLCMCLWLRCLMKMNIFQVSVKSTVRQAGKLSHEKIPPVAAGMIAFLCRPESARNVFDMKS